MKDFIMSVIVWAAAICAMSAAALPLGESAAEADGEAAELILPSEELLVCCGGEEGIRRTDLEEYAVYAVLAEIPYVLEEEALKAQVCAARTYGARRILEGVRENGAHITNDGGKYQLCLTDEAARIVYGSGYESAVSAVRAAAEATRGQIITYDGVPIVAAFHLSSAGATESAENVWGIDVPYLVSVPSDCTQTEHTLTYAEISARISAEFPSAGEFDGVKALSVSPAGTVLRAEVCGIDLDGASLADILNLESAAFTAADNGGSVTFTVGGSGHLAGMSMLGADAMAAQGFSYTEILAHYYTGSTVGCADTHLAAGSPRGHFAQ